jgi:hypothetical protein
MSAGAASGVIDASMSEHTTEGVTSQDRRAIHPKTSTSFTS